MPSKGQHFANCWTQSNFSLDLAFNIRGPEREQSEHPYFSSELNERDIVNRQSAGEKLKYVLKFYTGVHIT